MTRRIEAERAESNEKVVKFVQISSKLAVRAIIKSANSNYSAIDRAVYSPDDVKVGELLKGEKRVIYLFGRKFDYLINVERVKKLRNGVLHLDVLEEDAGYVIGRGGSNLKEAVEQLNKLGCSLKIIKVHRHSEAEGVI